MPKEIFPGFEDYANYDNETEVAPNLPFKDASSVEGRDLHSGAFATTIELDERNIVKINRLQKIYYDEGKARHVMPKDKERLIKKTGDPERDRREVVDSLLELAEEKRLSYKFMKEHFGEIIPELKLCIISESPRQDLEREGLIDTAGMMPEEVAKIPQAETTLLEVWENVNPRSNMSKMDHDQLEEVYHDPVFQGQIHTLAERAREVFLEKGIFLDLLGSPKGIPVRDKNNSTLFVRGQDDLLDLLNVEGDIFFPIRNTSYQNGKLKYFDLYPLLSLKVDLKDIRTLVGLVAQRDLEGVRTELAKGSTPERVKLFMLSYVVFLEKLAPVSVSDAK